MYKTRVLLYPLSMYHPVDGFIFNGGHLTKLTYTSG
jgi:hypothetical protein